MQEREGETMTRKWIIRTLHCPPRMYEVEEYRIVPSNGWLEIDRKIDGSVVLLLSAHEVESVEVGE